MKFQSGAVLLLLVVQPLQVAAQDKPIDEIVVGGDAKARSAMEHKVEDQLLVDTASILKQVPGANVNSNGTITGIAQYRGMYGDRVAVTIDNHGIVSGGPNAMDAPLSYVSPMITDAIIIERGIASVSSAPESIGGHVNSRLARGAFGEDDFGLSGFIGSRYTTNGNLSTMAGRLTVSDASHRFSLISEFDNSNDIGTPSGTIRPSAVDRERYDLSYAYTDGTSHVAVFAGRLDTTDSGTPALPMDIRYIETDLYGGHFLHKVSNAVSIDGRVSANDVSHVMDNFAMRDNPNPMMHRQTYATGSGGSAALSAMFDLDSSVLRVGSHFSAAEHDATITNPNNAQFRIANFADIERDLISLFGEWSVEHETSALEIGLSLRRVKTSSGNVGASGVMGNGLADLADAFNAADRDLTFNDIDAVIKYQRRAGNGVDWRFEVAQKSRAPSYQELYLWAPMQATGGLADGRTYVGNLELEPEVSRELNLGFELSGDRLEIAPQVFYKDIDDYIQGTPLSGGTANMVSMMMTGQPVLQFSNVAAEIWGFDVAWSYALGERWSIDGIASYTRGRRTDEPDDLYRLAPLNGNLGIRYTGPNWTAGARLFAYADQDEVSAYNGEQETDSYEIVTLDLVWMASDAMRLEARVDNLFDSTYQDHLTGINRANGSDIPVGTRLYGAERTLTAGVIYTF